MVSIRRRAKVAGDDPPVDEELNRSIEKLEDIHEELVMVDSEAMYKLLELEQNYAQIRREVYMKRNEIFKSIPNFWLTMFENHPALETLITEQDEEMLKYLLSFHVDEFSGVESGYTITFNFSSNPYFEDTNLTKTYSISHEGTVSKSDTKIKWKEGIDSANVSDHERECANRPFTEDSFISWFIEETLTNGATDEVGKIFKEDIWPDPLKYIRQEVFENEFKQKDDESLERMEENGSSGNSIPTVDLSLFFHQGSGNHGGQERAVAAEIIANACQTTGIFRITNHGIPQSLMKLALQHSKEFFGMSDEEKLKSKPAEPSAACPLPPAGYHNKLESSPEKFEFLFITPPSLGFNVYPLNPPDYRRILEECFASFSSTTLVIGELLNGCLGLPPNFLRDCNKERSRDFMLALRYFPAGSDSDDIGLEPHQDGTCFTLLFQDEVRGLQVLRDGDWIPIEPIEGSIIVIIGEIIQVLTNNKFKGAKHRVVRNERDRYSFSFFYTMSGNQLVEPLPQFTKEINERPFYHGFLYKEYLQNRMKIRTHPTSRQKPVITISHYAII